MTTAKTAYVYSTDKGKAVTFFDKEDMPLDTKVFHDEGDYIDYMEIVTNNLVESIIYLSKK